jgi:hypothetical protein
VDALEGALGDLQAFFARILSHRLLRAISSADRDTLENLPAGAHIREMSQAVAIVFGAGLIVLATMVTHHWELIPGGASSLPPR